MKAVLVALDAKFIQTNLAVRSLKKYVDKHSSNSDYSLDFLEYTINLPIQKIVDDLYHQKADVYLFSCYIWNIEQVKSVIRDLKQIRPAAKFFLGGPEATYDTDNLLGELDFLDGILLAEGEQTLLELLDLLQRKQNLSACDGLALPQGYTDPRAPIDIDRLPFPYDDFHALRNRTLYYESMRGCPFSCSYCLSSVDSGVRFRSPEIVFSDLKRFLNAKVKQVKFVDRTFNCNKAHAMSIWKFLKENDNGITNFHFEMAGDLLDDEMISLLKSLRPGLVQFEIGVQSTNPQTLAEIDRHFSFEKLSEKVNLLQQEQNIHLHLDLIAGLPQEDYQSFTKSFNDVYALRPHQLQLGFLKVLGGSKMQQNAEKYGLLYQSSAPYEVLQTSWISFDELSALHGVDDMVDHYYNSGRYSNLLECMIGDNPFDFYLQLSKFFNQQTGGKPVSKLGYYEILGNFWLQSHPEIPDSMQWFAKYDILLHENIRQYPSWIEVSLQNEYDNYIHNLYSDPEFLKEYLPTYSKKYPKQVERGDSRHASRHTRIEIFPFNPKTQEIDNTAILFDYFEKDILDNAIVTYIEI